MAEVRIHARASRPARDGRTGPGAPAAASRSRPTGGDGGRSRSSIAEERVFPQHPFGREPERASPAKDDFAGEHWRDRDRGVGSRESAIGRRLRSNSSPRRLNPRSRLPIPVRIPHPGISCSADDLAQHGPRHVPRAQAIGSAMPRPASGRVDESLHIERQAESRVESRIADPEFGTNDRNALRFFALGRAEVRIAVEPKQCGDLAIRPAWKHLQTPPEHRGRQAQRPKRVADVVLAIAERAFARTSRPRARQSTSSRRETPPRSAVRACRSAQRRARIALRGRVRAARSGTPGRRARSQASVGCRLPLEGLTRSAHRDCP